MKSPRRIFLLLLWAVVHLSGGDHYAVAAAPAASEAKDTVEVDAAGVGVDGDAAQKDALMNAVKEAVGMYVDGQTLVQKEEVIYDHVLSVSNGFVESSKVTKKLTKRRSDGLYEVGIHAVVRKGRVQQSLRDAKVIAAKVDAGDLWGEAVTRIASAQDARALLEQKLPPIASRVTPRLIQARLVDEGGKPLTGRSVPTAKTDTASGSVTCAWNVEVTWDRDVFYKEIVPVLRTCFDAVCVRKSEEFSRSTPFAIEPSGGLTTRDCKRRVAVINRSVRWLGQERRFPIEVNGREEIAVILNVGSDRGASGQKYVAYALPRGVYLDLMRSAGCHASVRIALMAADGKAINERDVPLDQTLLELSTMTPRRTLSAHRNPIPAEAQKVDTHALVRWQDNPLSFFAFAIAPEWTFTGTVHASTGGSYAYGLARTDALLLRHEVELSPDDLKDLKEVTVKVVTTPLK